jgi:uncharacterized membrane protein
MSAPTGKHSRESLIMQFRLWLRRPNLAQWLAAVIIVLGVTTLFALFFAAEVCDQQLTDDGRAVPVCRHVQLVDAPVVAVGLVLLVALGAFYSEVSGFGFTVKARVTDATRLHTLLRQLATQCSP